jgi:hypothetical protein
MVVCLGVDYYNYCKVQGATANTAIYMYVLPVCFQSAQQSVKVCKNYLKILLG